MTPSASEPQPKVLIVDDVENILRAVTRTLNSTGLYDIFFTQSPEEALRMVRQEGPFAVVISDQQMPGMQGTQLLAQIKSLSPETARILLTGYADLSAAVEAINNGAVFKYLNKPCEPERLLETVADGVRAYNNKKESRRLQELAMAQIELIRSNQMLMDEPLNVRYPASGASSSQPSTSVGSAELDSLTARELEILQLIGEGLSNKDISEKECISITTVKNHLFHIYKKLGVENRVQAVLVAQQMTRTGARR